MRATQSVWCGDIADLAEPLYELMAERVRASHVVATDDTIMPMLSKGKTTTRDQLYLALRLAYLEEYADRTEPIPFIGDDLVTSFDDEPTTQGLKALAATGKHIQPILFTHHKRVVELAQAELGNIVDIVALA